MGERIFQMSDSRNSSKCLFEAVSFKMHTDLTILLTYSFSIMWG